MSLHGVEETVSLCALMVGEQRFAMETHALREVRGSRGLRRVPLAPAFVAGVMPYRGDVLTAVSLRALLGLPEAGEGCVVVLDGAPEAACGQPALFGLVVDTVCGVVNVDASTLAPNPPTVGDTGHQLFDGAYRLPDGLMVRLEPGRLSPGRLRETQMNDQTANSNRARQGGIQCGH